MRFSKKHPFTDLKRNYILHFETGLILSLLSVIGLLKLDLPKVNNSSVWTIPDREFLSLENVPQTIHTKPKLPPPVFLPPKIPEYKLFKDRLRNLNIEFTIPQPLAEPAPITMHKNGDPGSYRKLESSESTLKVAEEMPQLIGGKEGLKRRIRYPQKAIDDNVQGRVVVQFIIDEHGKVHNPEILRSVRKDIDKEALKAISKSRFTPGRQKGIPVRIKYIMFIRFQLKYNS